MKLFLSAFADEAAKDFKKQLEILKKQGIPYIELRGLDGKNISAITEDEAKSYKKMLDESGIKVWALGSPIGKIPANGDFEKHLKEAEHVFRLAVIFGTKNVRMFSFYTSTPEEDEKEVIARLEKFVVLAEKYGVTLCHENEKGIYGDRADRCLNILQNVGGLKCVFDPANFVQCGEDTDYAYKILKDRIYYFHIKDALYDGTVVPAGEGEGNVNAIISKINGDKVLTVEPHLFEFTGYKQIDDTKLKNKYSFATNEESFTFAVNALKKLLKDNSFKEENGCWTK